jgi:hypothetical protein
MVRGTTGEGEVNEGRPPMEAMFGKAGREGRRRKQLRDAASRRFAIVCRRSPTTTAGRPLRRAGASPGQRRHLALCTDSFGEKICSLLREGGAPLPGDEAPGEPFGDGMTRWTALGMVLDASPGKAGSAAGEGTRYRRMKTGHGR